MVRVPSQVYTNMLGSSDLYAVDPPFIAFKFTFFKFNILNVAVFCQVIEPTADPPKSPPATGVQNWLFVYPVADKPIGKAYVVLCIVIVVSPKNIKSGLTSAVNTPPADKDGAVENPGGKYIWLNVFVDPLV